MSDEKKLVGFELEEKSIDIQGENVVASAKISHAGKIGKLSIKFEGELSAKPLIHSAIDFIEKKIPGDQTVWASLAKSAIDKAFA